MNISMTQAIKPAITHLSYEDRLLALYKWVGTPVKPKGAVLLVHGLGEHMGRYTHVAQFLQAAGYAVFGYDHHGHGLSSGVKGSLPENNQLVDDLHFVIAHVRSQVTGPLVLMGHSMGGLIAAEAAVRDYQNDHLVHRKISARLASWILRTGEKIVQQADSWKVPTLLLYSGTDKLVRAKSSDLFAECAPSHLVEAHCFKDMYHEILNDPEKEKVLTILVRWLDAHLK